MNVKPMLDQSLAYRIRVRGNLGDSWADYFYGMDICRQESRSGTAVTELTGCLPDQDALYDVLRKLYNLGFGLISAERIELV
jgi:hypothetical protein